MNTTIDLTRPEMSYLMGFLQTDGHLSQFGKNKGKISLELAERDAEVLPKLQALFSEHSSVSARERDTNFKEHYRSVVWSVFALCVRTDFNRLGLPSGKKSDTVAPPSVEFSAVDYYRGVVDGDGSLGFTAKGFPFLSLSTKSPRLAEAYVSFLAELLGKTKTTRPNARDAMYNIAVYKEDAQKLAQTLYYEGCLGLARKQAIAEAVCAWVRPETLRRRTWAVLRWTPEEDAVVLREDVSTAAAVLGRTERSIRVRRWRLLQQGSHQEQPPSV